MPVRGLLVEGVSQNLFKNSLLAGSEPLTNWTAIISGTRTQVVSDLGNADGAFAMRMVANAQQPCLQTPALALPDNTYFCVSFWVEQWSLTGGNPTVGYVLNAGTSPGNIDLNETNTAMPTTFPSRVTWRFRTGVGAGAAVIRLGLGAQDTASGTLQISRPQLEIGMTSTSFMPGGPNVTGMRSADVVTKLLSSFPYNASLGTWEAEFYAPVMFGTEGVILQTDSGAETSRVSLVVDATGHVRLIVTSGGTDTLNLDGGLITADAIHRAGFRYGASDWALAVDGNAVVKNATAAVPGGMTILRHGHGVSGRALNAELAKVTNFRSKKDDATLQSDTSFSVTPTTRSFDWWGWPYAAISLGNNNIKGSNKAAYRVRMPRTGNLKGFRWWLSAKIVDHTVNSGTNYGFGTGGIARGHLETNNPNSGGSLANIPTGTWVGGTSNYDQLVAPVTSESGWTSHDSTASEPVSSADGTRRNGFPYFTFPQTTPVTAGQIYHFVFDNADASPSNNWYSVDNLDTHVPGNPTYPMAPDADFGFIYTSSGNWVMRSDGYYPIITVEYTDGFMFGCSVIDTGQSPGGGGSVTSTQWARNSAISPPVDVTVTHLNVVAALVSGTGSLVVELLDVNNNPIDSVTWASSSLSTTEHSWAGLKALSSPRLLRGGTTYRLRYKASGGSYQIKNCPFSVSGWRLPAVQANNWVDPGWINGARAGQAEYSTNSGSTWSKCQAGSYAMGSACAQWVYYFKLQ